MKGILGFILLLFGLVNITSENSTILGWIATVLGVVLFASTLSGPYKRGRFCNGTGGGADSYSTNFRSDSDCSGGDGGGGGD